MKKTCRQCGLLAEHYNSITTCCKECWKTRVKANRKTKAEYYRKYDRERGGLPERIKMRAVRQRQKRREMGPDYMRAHNMVARRIASGQLIRPDHCSRCKIDCAPQAHHDDHSKALEIMWLCPICHAARHVELGKLNK